MMAKSVARWMALGALFLIPLTPLIVTNSFFFPFITGKGFFFRILVEVAVAGWAVLAIIDKRYRPRFSWIGVAAVGFVVWMFIADAFAVNVPKAFWSNFERMEGWILLAHLFGFFVVAGAVLRVEEKWRAWFLTSLGVSVIVCAYALLQLAGVLEIHQGSTRIDASLGNSAYLAIYLLFNVFIALWLALTERYSWLKWSLISLAVIEAILLFYTETRGAVIGLVVALSLSCVLTLITAGKRARQLSGIGLLLILVLVGSFYLARDSAFVQENHTLQRIASISLSDGQTRFTLWGMAFRGVTERPILGWGQEGFNYVFNKYYEPSLFKQEQWFDRAHNAFIDWIIAGGIPAFLLYLSLFGTAIVLLWKSSQLSRPERIALTAVLVGYATHNLFVFDNLYSYVYFFAVLALIDSQVGRPIKWIDEIRETNEDETVTYVMPVAAVACIMLVWLTNVTGMQVAGKLIKAMSPNQAGIAGNIELFTELTARPAFAIQEVREQLASLSSAAAQSQSVSEEDKRRVLTLAVEEMEKQVTAYPRDARGHLQLAYVYRAAGDIEKAFASLKKAVAESPSKVEIWIQIGGMAFEMGNGKEVQEAFTNAYKFGGPFFPELAVYAAAGNIAVGDIEAADKILMDTYGTTKVDSDVLSAAYYRTQNWPRLIGLWKARVESKDAPVEAFFSLGAAYYAAGQKENALATIREAAKRFPGAAESAEAAIAQIEGRAAK